MTACVVHADILADMHPHTLRCPLSFIFSGDKTADGKVVCNTGSITFPKENNVPTFAILDNGVLSIRNLENKILKQVEV